MIFVDKFNKMIEDANNAKNEDEKVKIIRDLSNSESAILKAFDIIFNESIKFKLPKGPVTFKPLANALVDSAKLQLSNMIRSDKLQPLFIETGLTKEKLESLFISFCETLDPRDADFLINNLKDKIIPKGLDRDIVIKAFPQFSIVWAKGGVQQQEENVVDEDTPTKQEENVVDDIATTTTDKKEKHYNKKHGK